MSRFFVFTVLFFSVFGLFAGQYGGSPLGPDVAEFNGKKLQWEGGAYDYFVMFKSLLENTDPANDNNGQNPSADKCLSASTYTLDASKVPLDAYVEAAYIVWNAAVKLDGIKQPTDNSVHLKFEQQDNEFDSLETDVVTSKAHLSTDTDQSFEFEGVATQPTEAQSPAWVTYRADITDFFNKIHQAGRSVGLDNDGVALFGNYTVSGLDCTEDDFYSKNNYGSNSVMVSNWSIVLVYRSEEVPAKNVYIYRGFDLYQFQATDITVRGFEFPADPIIKISMLVSEGDPGLAINQDPSCGSGGLIAAPCPPEGLQLKGMNQSDFIPLFNECNPPRDKDSNGNPYNYTEMYNSISSVYGWGAETPSCSGNYGDLSSFEYGMDFDTFRLDSSNPPFDQQLKEDDTEFTLKVGANADMIFTNLLVVSVDTRAPKFDIPVNDNTPSGREKNFCSCAPEGDRICPDFPFYFAVKIQNWGDDTSEHVTLQDSLTSLVTYVPGSTEICHETDDKDMCTKWEKVDDANGKFPFAEAREVAEKMAPCNRTDFTCTDTVWVRFKVTPQSGLPKHAVIENTAFIADSTGAVYKSNTSIPLRLKLGSCPDQDTCLHPDMDKCGGNVEDKCTKDSECGLGMKCDDGTCVMDDTKVTSNVAVIIDRSPKALPLETMIIPSPSKGITLAQFSIQDISGTKNKVFFLKRVSLKVNKVSQDVELTNVSLYTDENGNGMVDEDDHPISTVSSVRNEYAIFDVPHEQSGVKSGTVSYFIVKGDAAFASSPIPSKTTFSLSIEKAENVDIVDAGKPSVSLKSTPLKFSEYRFEPDGNYVVVSKSITQPSVPAPEDINGVHQMMNITIKATENDNKLKSLMLKTVLHSAPFTEGIGTITVWNDKNGNYINDDNAKLVTAEPQTPSSVLLTFSPPLELKAGQPVSLMLYADLSLSADQFAQVSLKSARDVKLSSTSTVIGPPLTSAQFSKKQQGGGDNGGTDDDGCSVIAVPDVFDWTALFGLIAAVLLMTSFMRIRKQ